MNKNEEQGKDLKSQLFHQTTELDCVAATLSDSQKLLGVALDEYLEFSKADYNSGDAGERQNAFKL